MSAVKQGGGTIMMWGCSSYTAFKIYLETVSLSEGPPEPCEIDDLTKCPPVKRKWDKTEPHCYKKLITSHSRHLKAIIAITTVLVWEHTFV